MERVMGGKVEEGGADTPFVLHLQGGMHVASCEEVILKTRRDTALSRGCFGV